MRLYSCFYIPVARAPDGANCEAGDFHANLAFSFLDNTQRSIIIYTRARVSLLSSCSLEHGPSIIAEKQAVEMQFLRQQWALPGAKGLNLLWTMLRIASHIPFIFQTAELKLDDAQFHTSYGWSSISQKYIIATKVIST